MPTISLDDLLDRFGPPSLVKIDVEGAEVEVLRGATRLLKEVRPVFYLEIGSEEEAECKAILSEARYRFQPGAEMNWLVEPV